MSVTLTNACFPDAWKRGDIVRIHSDVEFIIIRRDGSEITLGICRWYHRLLKRCGWYRWFR